MYDLGFPESPGLTHRVTRLAVKSEVFRVSDHPYCLPQPLEPGEVHPPDFYSVSLVEGHLDIQLNGGTGIERIMSAEKFNDGQLHSISVIKENRRCGLLEMVAGRVGLLWDILVEAFKCFGLG